MFGVAVAIYLLYITLQNSRLLQISEHSAVL